MIRTRLQGDTPFFPNMLNNGKVEVCLKEDVDKVLVEKDKVIADLEESHKKEVEQATLRVWAELQLRHNKYKRCLAMADMCSEAICYWDNVKYTFFKGEAYCFRKLNHYGKWGQIWLAISEKFKEEVE